MGYYSVDDFNLPYPAWPRPLRRVRNGARTAFVDKATGELVAGYSYETCLFAVAISPEFPEGRLYENLTAYSVTTSGKHSYPLRRLIAKRYTGDYDWGKLPDGSYGYFNVTLPIAPVAEAIDVPRGTTAAELVVRCQTQPPVDVCVAARRAKVDAFNAALDAGDSYPEHDAHHAYRVAMRAYTDPLSSLCGEACRAERRASEAIYGDDRERRWARDDRRRARAEQEAVAARVALQPLVDAHIARVAASLDAAPVAAQANGVPPGCVVIDGKIYGKR